MLRDRLPKFVSFALKFCKVKERWLDHVYNYSIRLGATKKERLIITRKILGYEDPENMKNKRREFKFEDTLQLGMCDSEEEKIFWEKMTKFVSWFQKTVPYIENEYLISKSRGVALIDIKRDIMFKWLKGYFPLKEDDANKQKLKKKFVNELADYLIDCFENLN